MKVWITRNKGFEGLWGDNTVYIWTALPQENKINDIVFYTYASKCLLFDLHYKTFEERYGFTPEEGTCTEKELILK